MSKPEFDNYSASYDDLLKDPIRDGFAGSSLFFHVRKRDLVRDYFKRSGIDPKGLRYLDVGCGKGELLSLLAGDFAQAAGCDPSSGMLKSALGVEVRVQQDPTRIPFEDGQFDFITAVCVYHHVPPHLRPSLTAEIKRLLTPGGVFAIIEHNPWNPATRLIVSRTPVDADAILLGASETRSLMRSAGFSIHRETYFLYLPEMVYSSVPHLETLLRRVPLGGQYAVFGRAGVNSCEKTPNRVESDNRA
jgi:SAM-dependent methyltransferase